ncbi:MAG: FecR domain-containing protein [Candidatus Omnitrophica bacterium]|nr:FecR domain-containing protein [Candidatus Omnitrophota bacterium]
MRKIIITTAAIIVVIAVFSNYHMPNAQDKLQRRGEVIEIEGKAEVKVAGSEAWKPAESGMEIRSGDMIRALEGSYADLSIDKLEERNAIVRVGESSTIKPYIFASEVIINIITGKVVFWAAKREGKLDKFEIRTPNSIIGIEGSHGIVNYDAGVNATDTYLEVSGGYIINIDSGQHEELYRGPNYVQVQKKDIKKDKKKKKIYSWDLHGFYGSYAFAYKGLRERSTTSGKYNKSYFSGKYATTIDCITGEVAIGPYNEMLGPNFDEGITLYTGQQVRIEDTIYMYLGAKSKEEESAIAQKEDKEERDAAEEKRDAAEEKKKERERERKEKEDLELKDEVEDIQKDVP